MNTKHHCPFLAITLVHGYTQYVQQNRTCCMLACTAICLPARHFARGPKKWEKLDTDCWEGCPYPPSHSAITSRKASGQYEAQWFASLQTPQEALGWQAICNRCRHEANRQLLAAEAWNISSTSRYKPWCHGGADAYVSILYAWRSDVYHLLPKCHVYTNIRTMFLAVDCWWPNILKFHI